METFPFIKPLKTDFPDHLLHFNLDHLADDERLKLE
jgi:hypothetical protein